jgi:VWFA-related protein
MRAQFQMKNINRFLAVSRFLACAGFLLLGAITISPGQEIRKNDPNVKPEKDFTIRIGVEEVRLDVVVLDKKGHQISDLMKDDFEVYQDNVPMPVQASKYIVDQTTQAKQLEIAAAPKKATPVPKSFGPISTKPLARDQVRRVIAFVIDDLTLDYQGINYSRQALKKFVEKQMLPGDVMAIMKTSRGNSQLQVFLSDKKQIMARIDAIHWAQSVGYDRQNNYDNLYSYFEGQLLTLRYCIYALRDMPGRKAIVLMSNQTTLPSSRFNDMSVITTPVDYNYKYSRQYEKLADDALRAGVVVHTMDMHGLEAAFPDAINPPTPDGSLYDPFGSRGPGSAQMGIRDRTPDQISQLRLERQLYKIPLSEKTGGLYITDNSFINGIQEIDEALKGYYMLSYVPPAYTFRQDQTNRYRTIKVKVKRSGASVHTRDGFMGVPTMSNELASYTVPMKDVLFSPFKYSDVRINMASGYINDSQKGYLVRSWLHLNWDDLAKSKTTRDNNGKLTTLQEGEGQFVSVDTVNVTSNINGEIMDFGDVRYTFRIKDENIPQLQKQGLRFCLTLPIKKPGQYYIRVAVKDEKSGKFGSAYQFVEIPDLKTGHLALSNVFIINDEDDVAWIQTGSMEKGVQSILQPQMKQDESRSLAVREFRSGENVRYMLLVYNAKHTEKELPSLEYSAVLYKDGQELSRSQTQALDFTGANDSVGYPIKGKVTLADLEDGDYILQFVVTDKRLGGKKNSVTQSFDFRVTSAPSGGNVALAN